ncbi:MAG: hypothetical protein KDK39_19595 [Leptospiraceae bacterium]|nr:hypothetical protein [Leptospiraceae bacterium]
MFVIGLLAQCATDRTIDMPTGVFREKVSGDAVELRIVARASQNAIARQSPAMMRTTSCRAARDMLHAELQNGFYVQASENFASTAINLYQGGKFCEIVGQYNPAGLGPDLKSRAINLDQIR